MKHVCCQVTETRRGRCGEYSVLMLLFLEGLEYDTRYILDREDHVSRARCDMLCCVSVTYYANQVWVEVLVGGSWIHVDPCEASVDEPLLYERWGKNQTFIFAFHQQNVADVTRTYTTNHHAMLARRHMEGVNESFVVQLMKKSGEQLDQQ